MEKLNSLQAQNLSISQQFFQNIAPSAKAKKYTKGELLLKEGQVCHRLYFIEKGTIRTFYEHEEKDITSWIYADQQSFTSWYSFLNREPSFENIEVLEPSIIQSISFDELQKLYTNQPKLERIGRQLAEYQLSFLDIYYKGYMFMSAKERYDLLLSYFPDVLQRVNLGHIASLLGISQETLSRIRRK